MITPDYENSRQSRGSVPVLGGYCDLPTSSNNTGEDVWLTIWYWQPQFGGTPSITGPTANGVTGSLRAGATGVKIYSFPGGTIGPANFTFSDPCTFRAFAVRVTGLKSSSPYSSAYSNSPTGFSHSLVAGINSPFAGAAFVGAASVPFVQAFGVQFISPDNIFQDFYVNDIDLTLGALYICGGSLAIRIADAASEPNAHTWNSITADNRQTGISVLSGLAGFWASPSQAPSTVTFLSPLLGMLFTVGRDVPVLFTAASDPTVASSSLTYDIEYRLHGAASWVSLTTTGAGVTSYNWDTTGLTPSNAVQLRVRADNGTETGPWVESAVFSLLADSPPGPPLDVQPTGNVNQQEDLTVSWRFNDPGDLQLAVEIEWDDDPAFGSSSTTGTITQSDESYTFTAATDILSSADDIYYRVRNQGVVDATDGAWSAVRHLVVVAPISAPNITFPTNASPPLAGVVQGTFTGTGHVQIQYEVLQGATRLLLSSPIPTSANTFNIAVQFADTVTYTLKLRRAGPDGFWSAWDSETFTVSYTGPDQPTLTGNTLDSRGYIQFECENTDPNDIAYQDLFANGVLIATNLPANFLFNYAGARSGEAVEYFVRAYIEVTFGFTDSDPIELTQELTSPFIFEHTKESTTANFVDTPIELTASTNEPEVALVSAMVNLRNRTAPVIHVRRGYDEILTYNLTYLLAQLATVNQIEEWRKRGARVCVRDNRAHKIFGKIISAVPSDWMSSLTLPLTVQSEHYDEEVET